MEIERGIRQRILNNGEGGVATMNTCLDPRASSSSEAMSSSSGEKAILEDKTQTSASRGLGADLRSGT